MLLLVAVIGGGAFLFLEVRRLSGRIIVRAEYLDASENERGRTPFGLGVELFTSVETRNRGPWLLDPTRGGEFSRRTGEKWSEAITRSFPEVEVVTFDPVKTRWSTGQGDEIGEFATVILRVADREPEAYLAAALGTQLQTNRSGSTPAVLLRLNEPASREFALRGVNWSRRSRSWFEVLTGAPKHAVVISVYRGNRSVDEMIRWANGPPWGAEILEKALAPERRPK